jgi:uncharacterized phage protein gp47/JayE
MHGDLSEQWGFNTRQNPQSFLNVLITDFADKIAELWEYGQDIYSAMYPFSAEGLSLDNATQFGGISRDEARSTIYPVHCECVDGTVIPPGTLIKSITNPEIDLQTNASATVSRSAFNSVKVVLSALQANAMYTVILDSLAYSVTSGTTPSASDILTALADLIAGKQFAAAFDGTALSITAAGIEEHHNMILSSNLTTQSVVGIVNFSTLEIGDTDLPSGTITGIKTAVPGLLSVNNFIPRIAGNLRETDVDLRSSYIAKIFQRSNRMLESIKSAILRNVQGVISVAGYQNDTNIVDAEGRWPHCVEIVVEGGGNYEIAMQIWSKKAAGINTFGSTEVIVPGDEGEPITIRFNRPEHVFVWFRLFISVNPAEILPSNYADAIKTIIMDAMASADVAPGTSIIPQRLIEGRIYTSVPGIAYIDTQTFYSTDSNQQPAEFANGMVPITPRQRAVTDAARIEVMLSG